VDQALLVATATLSLRNGDSSEFGIGPVFKRTASDTTETGTLVAERRPYGSGTLSQVGLQASLDHDTRDHLTWPTRGIHLTVDGAYYPELVDLASPVVEARGELATYVSPGGGNPTLATRVGGKHVWGTFPYYEAALLGGSANVRGLREQRFAGRSSAYGSAELRAKLGLLSFFFPAEFGVFGFGDLGRVFQDDLASDAWHTTYGGGLWIAPVTRATTIQVSMAKSENRAALYFGLGFGF
jgi:outer membrane protein assembly factor BamA